MKPEIEIFADPEQLARTAAGLIVDAARAAVDRAGRFTLVLAGGHTPEKTYAELASGPRAGEMPWDKTYFFFGDERFVPAGDPRSNFGMAQRVLLSVAPVMTNHVVAIPTNTETPAEGATLYARLLSAFFRQPLDGPPPQFDMILLGLGDDGHTASLFPRAAALDETKDWAVASPPGSLPPPVDRITLTYPVLNAAREVLFLVAGAGKAVAVRDVLSGTAQRSVRPAAAVQPTNGRLRWLLDRAAAVSLDPSQSS